MHPTQLQIDNRIEVQVRQALRKPVFAGMSVLSSVNHGVVTLAGTATRLAVRLMDESDAKAARTGGMFYGTTASTVSCGGYTLIPSGTEVTGRIAEAKAAATSRARPSWPSSW